MTISLVTAELLAAILEGPFYGFSLFMFGGTIWTLLSGRSMCRVKYKMLTVACLLLLFSTMHLGIIIVRAIEGLVLSQDTVGGPVGYFMDRSQWTFLYMNYVFVAQTLLGNAVVLYRCYVAWESKRVMVLPALLWCSIAVTGIGYAYISSHTQQISTHLFEWVASFLTLSLIGNVSITALLAFRIWYVDKKARRIYGPGKSRLRPMLYIIVDAGVIYSLSVMVSLILFQCGSNFQYLILYLIPPIISITFYMVIIRMGLANRTKHMTNTSQNPSANSGLAVQVHITRLTDSRVDGDNTSSMAVVDHESFRTEDKDSGGSEAV